MCEQGRGGGGVAAESGALMGNHNREADAEAAHGPYPSVQREPSRADGVADEAANGAADGTANGAASQAPANGNAASSSSSSDEDMENGQAGPTGKGSKAAKS